MKTLTAVIIVMSIGILAFVQNAEASAVMNGSNWTQIQSLMGSIYVGNGGYSTLQAGIDATDANGDGVSENALYVSAGSYTPATITQKDLTVYFAPGAKVVAPSPGTALTINSSVRDHHYVTIFGGEFTGGANSTGINITRAASVRMYNFNITNVQFGINITETNTNRFKDGTLIGYGYGVGFNLIDVNPSENVIDGNQITSFGNGVQIRDPYGDMKADNNKILNNFFYSNNHSIDATTGWAEVITGNYFEVSVVGIYINSSGTGLPQNWNIHDNYFTLANGSRNLAIENYMTNLSYYDNLEGYGSVLYNHSANVTISPIKGRNEAGGVAALDGNRNIFASQGVICDNFIATGYCGFYSSEDSLWGLRIQRIGAGNYNATITSGGVDKYIVISSSQNNTADRTIKFSTNNGSNAIATGVQISGDVKIPCTGTIIDVTASTDQGGDSNISWWSKPYSLNSPPTAANEIGYFNTSGSTLIQQTGLSQLVTAGWIMRFNVNSNNNVTKESLNLGLRCS